MARTTKKEKALTPEEKLAQALVPDVEQPSAIDVEGLDHPCLFGLDVGHVFYGQIKRFRVVDGLLRVTVAIEYDACEQRGVILYCCHDSLSESLFVETAIEYIQIGDIITRLTDMSHALSVDTIHRFT